MNTQFKKILVDLTPVLPGGENGGAKIFILELLSQMAKLSRETHFTLLIQKNCYQELKFLESENISFEILGEKPKNYLVRLKNIFISNYWVRLLKFFFKKAPYRIQAIIFKLGFKFYKGLRNQPKQASSAARDPDLLFCPFTAPFYYKKTIPTVCVIYDLQFKTYPEFFSGEELMQREIVFKEACRKGTILSTISNYSRESILRHGQIEPERVRTIYLQTRPRNLEKNPVFLNFLEKNNLTPYQYLFYPANYWKHKNHEMLLTAFGTVCEKNTNLKTQLVFTGANESRYFWLREIVQKMGLENNVIFLGYVSNLNLSLLMKHSLGVIFPSLYEGFGLPMIEAMAAEIPIACSNVTALPEIVGDAALLFDPRIPSQIAEAMFTLSSNEPVRQALIKKGRERVKHFTHQSQMAEEYLALFKEAICLHQHS